MALVTSTIETDLARDHFDRREVSVLGRERPELANHQTHVAGLSRSRATSTFAESLAPQAI